MTTTRTLKDIDDEYTTLCGQLGDLIYKSEKEITKFKARMTFLSVEAEKLQAETKPAEVIEPAKTNE